MSAVAVRLAHVVVVALLAGGCGNDTALPDEIAGSQVGTMAERELEAQNPGIAAGTLVCPDLSLDVGAEVRCVRTAELSEGRVVKVDGTVEVTSLSSGGRLHVTMDDRASEFGVTGDQVATEVRARFGARPAVVACPYLLGKVGTVVTCRVEVGSRRLDVRVEVTAVDPHSYRTTYVVRRPYAAS
jgi:hypothetical protein